VLKFGAVGNKVSLSGSGDIIDRMQVWIPFGPGASSEVQIARKAPSVTYSASEARTLVLIASAKYPAFYGLPADLTETHQGAPVRLVHFHRDFDWLRRRHCLLRRGVTKSHTGGLAMRNNDGEASKGKYQTVKVAV
jgi:hypothetical protein